MTIKLENGLTYTSKDDKVIVSINIVDITMDILLDRFPSDYNSFYGGRGVTMPSTTMHQRTCIRNADSLNYWRDNFIKKYGEVTIVLGNDDDVWFDKTKVLSDEFTKDEITASEQMKKYIENERLLGRSID